MNATKPKSLCRMTTKQLQDMLKMEWNEGHPEDARLIQAIRDELEEREIYDATMTAIGK
jgi:hypothetical protein